MSSRVWDGSSPFPITHRVVPRSFAACSRPLVDDKLQDFMVVVFCGPVAEPRVCGKTEDRRCLQNAGHGSEEQLLRSGRHRGFRGANTGQELSGSSRVPSLAVQERRGL